MLEGELRRVDADDDESVLAVGLRPGADVRLLAQPVDAGQRPEVHQHDVAAQLGGAEWLRVEPLGRPVQWWHVHPLEHRSASAATGTLRGALRKRAAALARPRSGCPCPALKWTRLGYACSAQLRGTDRSQRGNVTPTGMDTPLASKKPSLFSQYRRAEETPVFVSQVRVMLSRISSRVRLPTGSELLDERSG